MITLALPHDVLKWIDGRKMKKSVIFEKWDVGCLWDSSKKLFQKVHEENLSLWNFSLKYPEWMWLCFLTSVSPRLSNDNFRMVTRRFKVIIRQENDNNAIFFDLMMQNCSKLLLKGDFPKIQNHSTLSHSTEKSKSHIKNPKPL